MTHTSVLSGYSIQNASTSDDGTAFDPSIPKRVVACNERKMISQHGGL